MDEIFDLINNEKQRQQETLMMIPSENYASPKVMKAVGSVLMNKYSEGYPGRRYYQGNKFIDKIETLAIERAKNLFGVPFANVQAYSGSPANSAVYFALANPGDTIMGLSLSSGGHLTHGHPNVTFSGKYFKSIQFGLDKNGLLNYQQIKDIAKKEKPTVMMIGTTAYPLRLDWEKFGDIADSINAWLVADISHVAGLIVAGVYPDPKDFAHIITTTTHKTLRGPRGAIIMVTKKGLKKDPDLGKKINSAIIPGLQGGPHNNQTAAIAICLAEASTKAFQKYAKKVIENAKVLSDELENHGLVLVAGGTESHLMLIDLRDIGLSGNIASIALEAAGIIVNQNSVPNDTMPPFYPSGVRLGTPAVTTRGMGKREMKKIAEWIYLVIEHVKVNSLPNEPDKRSVFVKKFKERASKDKYLLNIRKEVKVLCQKYPINQ